MSFDSVIAEKADAYLLVNPNATPKDAYMNAYRRGSQEGLEAEVEYLTQRLADLESECLPVWDPFKDDRLVSWYDPSHESHVGHSGSLICLPDLKGFSHLHIAPSGKQKPIYTFDNDGLNWLGCVGGQGIRSSDRAQDGPQTQNADFTIVWTFALATPTSGTIASYSAAGGGKSVQISQGKFYLSQVGQFSQVTPQTGVKIVLFIEVSAAATNYVWFVGSNAPIVETFAGSPNQTRIGMSLGCHASGGQGFSGFIGPCGAFNGLLSEEDKQLIRDTIYADRTPESPDPPPQNWLTRENGVVLVGTSVAQNGGYTRVPWPIDNNQAVGGSSISVLGTTPQSTPTAYPLTATVAEYEAGEVVLESGVWPIHGNADHSYERKIIEKSPDVVIIAFGENDQPYTFQRIGDYSRSNQLRNTIAGAWNYLLDAIYVNKPDTKVIVVSKWRDNDEHNKLMLQMLVDGWHALGRDIAFVNLAENNSMTEPLTVPGPYTNDGVHPNKGGADEIGKALTVLLRDL